MKRIQTVMGAIAPEQAGITLPHEHLLFDGSVYGMPPQSFNGQSKSRQPITLKNRNEIEHCPYFYEADLVMLDPDLAIEEAKYFRWAGGQTLVDVSGNFGRDVQFFYKTAVETGLNIVFSSGYYVAGVADAELRKKSADDIAAGFESDFLDGIGFLKLKPGILGELGLSDMSNEFEIRNLSGTARAQARIGCALNIHPTLITAKGEYAKDAQQILDIIEENGGNLQKTVISHCDLHRKDPDYLDAIAKRGAYVEFDQFGMKLSKFPAFPNLYLPCDLDRVDAIAEQIRRGNLSRLLISHDTAYARQLRANGGGGYAHIMENIVPMMIHYGGISQEDVYTILVKNPQEMLAF